LLKNRTNIDYEDWKNKDNSSFIGMGYGSITETFIALCKYY